MWSTYPLVRAEETGATRWGNRGKQILGENLVSCPLDVPGVCFVPVCVRMGVCVHMCMYVRVYHAFTCVLCACMVCAVCICVNVNVHEYVHTCMLRVRGDRVTPGHSSAGSDPGAGAAPGRRVTLPAGFQGSRVSRARPSRQSLGLRVKRGARSEIVNHCFLAGCLPLLIQVAITHSEYLATN